MPLAKSAALVAIGLLFTSAYCAAEDRSASSSQRYRIHVPSEVKFGTVEPAAVSEPVAQPAKEDSEPLVFMAETTSGLTIQFDSQSASPPPLKLTVGDSQQGDWWANEADDTGTIHEPTAEGTSVQASTLGAGWTTLTIDVVSPSAVADPMLTTIVVTIVAH